MRRAQQQTITFTCLDATGARLTGLSFAAGELKLSKDGGALADPTNSPTELGLGLYALVLTAAETNAAWLALVVNKTGVSPNADQAGWTSDEAAAAVVADAGNTATTFVTDLAETATDFWRYTGVRFTSGSLQGQVREISSYNGTTKAITLAAPLTDVPAGGDLFNLI